MLKDPKFNTVAKAIRLEYVQETGEMYIVFQITDEQFKNRIKADWKSDVELRLIDKCLVLKDED